MPGKSLPCRIYLTIFLSHSPMEAVSSSALQIQRFKENSLLIHTPKTSNKHCALLRVGPSLCNTPYLRVSRVSALAHEVPDEDSGKEGSRLNNDNGVLGLVPEEITLLSESVNGYFKWLVRLCCDGVSHILKGDTDVTDLKQSSEKDVKFTSPQFMVSYGNISGGGTRAGLFRTPISGGVQSATSAHGLPRPALAVRNLMEQARFAHLCTVMSRMHHRREGYPFGSLVDFAPDSLGHPIFSFSPLAIHTRNLLADPRCTLVVQIPGWSGLSNARVTIFGDIYPLPEDKQEWAHKQYIAKHHQGPSQQWGNFYYFRMQNISDIYFIGGFGTVAWVDVNEYETIQPDKIAVDGGEQNLKELNALFSKPLKELLSKEAEVDDAALISIDSKGVDVRARQGVQFNVQRISFEELQGVETLDEAKKALWNIINRGRIPNLQE
ncbi:pyridoxamine 5'-phosphate oxidase family protein [Striga asiatica]|uniref:Pyridoxamine 5'-phosphate oxidase family protein n=1 Tax=Striga asiatica TaxID=4170 RepID=A0A5A7R7H3_STRAF|nr:pyridoxamine 5'-phosphate oxidase family protein [Striga asiatica]